jgi:hypothetical protein
MDKVILIISQLVFSYFRTTNVIHNSKGLILKSIFSGTMVKVSWLVSTYLGVNSLITKDYFMIVLYLISGVAGDYLGLLTNKNKK